VSTRDIGKVAERSAVVYLKSRGYKILCINWTCYAGEIDIVAFRDKLVFVEVKSAFSGLCSPCELFTSRKKKNLSRAIRKFLTNFYSCKKSFPEWQADLVCVEKIDGRTLFSHYENVVEAI
jgi:Holliday junction resolvase-like predicted endonuclease